MPTFIDDRVVELENELEAIRFERDMLRALLDSQPFLTYAIDNQLRYVFSNKLHRQLLGVESLDEVVGKTAADLFGPEQVKHFQDADRNIIESGESVEAHEERFEPIEGRVSWLVTNKFPAKDENENVIGMVGTTRDITEEKNKQEVIKSQQETLREVGTPIIPIAEGIVILPLIGDVDSHRAMDIMRATLTGISEYRADIIIIDITGVPVVDTGVASYFNRTIQAVKLKGAKAIVTGISESVAEAIVDLGIDWSNVVTMPDLQSGLQRALVELKMKL